MEHFPILSENPNLEAVNQRYQDLLKEIGAGKLKTEFEIWDVVDRLLYHRPQNWKDLSEYDHELMSCNIWGHVCPVFLTQSGATETVGSRNSGRHISREIMLQVVRRDNYHCHVCGEHVRDNEMEFDHVIPFSRGGPTTVENLRVTHRSCNRKRSNDTIGLVID